MNTHTKQVLTNTMPFRFQQGMTLVEIMVAIAISMFLLGGLIQIVVGNKQTYRVQDAMARVQENGRFSMQFLTKDVRMAGYMGCGSTEGGVSVNNNVDASTFGDPSLVTAAIASYDGSNAVDGYTYTGGALDPDLAAMGITTGTNEGDIYPNTDVLFVRRAYSCPGGGVGSHNNNAAGAGSASMTIEDNATCGIQQDDVVMVTNCQTADIFGVTNVVMAQGAAAFDTIAHGSNHNLSPQLANGYGPDSFVLRMASELYYIGYGSSGEPSLFKRSLVLGGMVSNELVEGIEGMTILYGEDRSTPPDGTADIYVSAGSVTDMDNVVSIRITTSARTLEDNIANADTAEGDRRIRRSFTTTIGIRNRMS